MSNSKKPKSENEDDKAAKDEVTATPDDTGDTDAAETPVEDAETDAATKESGDTSQDTIEAEDTQEASGAGETDAEDSDAEDAVAEASETEPDAPDSDGTDGDGTDAAAEDARDRSEDVSDAFEAADAPDEEPETASRDETPVSVDTQEDDAPAQETAQDVGPERAAPEGQTVVERRGGFGAMLFGGVAAAAVGFGAAQYESGDWPFGDDGSDTFRADVTAALADQDDRLDSLSATVQENAGTTDSALTRLEDDLAATSGAIDETRESVAALSDRIGALETLPEELAALETRLTDLAKRPIEDNVSREAIKAYEDELERLRASMEEQRKAIEDTIAAEKAKMEKIAAEATQMEERALAEARLAAARSAITRVLNALDTGDTFGAALTGLAENIDTPVPDALSAVAETGVATQASLREEFPDLARAALRAARADAPAEEGESGIGSVLEKMFEVRSVKPREGDDADAVLSRAEAAVRAGDLKTALTEIDALPDVAKAELESWVAAANARFAALDAAQGIAQQLNR